MFSSAAGGEIFNQCVAENDEAFTEKDVIRLARQILTGVACLHRNNVVHLDLKVSRKLISEPRTKPATSYGCQSERLVKKINKNRAPWNGRLFLNCHISPFKQ